MGELYDIYNDITRHRRNALENPRDPGLYGMPNTPENRQKINDLIQNKKSKNKDWTVQKEKAKRKEEQNAKKHRWGDLYED